MKIQALNSSQSFTHSDDYMKVKNGRTNFYYLSDSSKLNVIYDMLNEQKKDLITLSKNQDNMHGFNKRGFENLFMSDPLDVNEYSCGILDSDYKAAKVNVIV